MEGFLDWESECLALCGGNLGNLREGMPVTMWDPFPLAGKPGAWSRETVRLTGIVGAMELPMEGLAVIGNAALGDLPSCTRWNAWHLGALGTPGSTRHLGTLECLAPGSGHIPPVVLREPTSQDGFLDGRWTSGTRGLDPGNPARIRRHEWRRDAGWRGRPQPVRTGGRRCVAVARGVDGSAGKPGDRGSGHRAARPVEPVVEERAGGRR